VYQFEVPVVSALVSALTSMNDERMKFYSLLVHISHRQLRCSIIYFKRSSSFDNRQTPYLGKLEDWLRKN